MCLVLGAWLLLTRRPDRGFDFTAVAASRIHLPGYRIAVLVIVGRYRLTASLPTRRAISSFK